MRIYVGNLSYSVGDDALRTAFEPFGTVKSAEVVMDRNTNRSRGFGFVEMENDDEARAAIETLHEQPLEDRALNVNEARPRQTRTDSRESGSQYRSY